jgi:hypothetical protein
MTQYVPLLITIVLFVAGFYALRQEQLVLAFGLFLIGFGQYVGYVVRRTQWSGKARQDRSGQAPAVDPRWYLAIGTTTAGLTLVVVFVAQSVR